MSQIHSEAVLCPACGHERMVTLFRSLNAERVPGQILRILDGNFEQLVCPACQHVFRPQHQLLYSHFSLRIWIVMYPPEARMTFLSLEEGLMPVFAAQFAAAPNIIRTALRGISPRLVFGQHFLAEAVRSLEAGLDPAELECLKLLIYREQLAHLLPLGPAELCLDSSESPEELQFTVYRLGTAERLDTISVSAEALRPLGALHAELEARYAALFHRPYVSATRYLFPAMAPITLAAPAGASPVSLY